MLFLNYIFFSTYLHLQNADDADDADAYSVTIYFILV